MKINKATQLRHGVRQAYSAVADNPQAEHPFPVGRQFAESLGYSPGVLADLPAAAVEAFAGVSNVAVFADIPEGATVLDLGCGAGLDSLIAAGRVGPAGRVLGIDFSESMLTRLLFADITLNDDQEGVGTQGLRALGRGIVAGTIGGLLFTVVMVQHRCIGGV